MRWASTNVEALTSSLDIVQRKKKMGLGTDEERSDCVREREGGKTVHHEFTGGQKNLP